MSVKDLFDYPGVDSTIGLAGWIGNASANKSVVVKILEEQGAIVFAKTNIPQSEYGGVRVSGGSRAIRMWKDGGSRQGRPNLHLYS